MTEEQKEVHGYLHNVSPMKVSKNQNRYFNAILQTGPHDYQDLVCYNPEKRTQMKSLEENCSPVKLSNITLSPGKRRRADSYAYAVQFCFCSVHPLELVDQHSLYLL